MHTVELLAEARRIADELGYETRHEWLGGTGGGACEFAGRKWIFIDLALNAVEQLEQVTEALRSDPAIHLVNASLPMQHLLGIRRAAA